MLAPERPAQELDWGALERQFDGDGFDGGGDGGGDGAGGGWHGDERPDDEWPLGAVTGGVIGFIGGGIVGVSAVVKMEADNIQNHAIHSAVVGVPSHINATEQGFQNYSINKGTEVGVVFGSMLVFGALSAIVGRHIEKICTRPNRNEE
jgi:hypothetical protein